MAAPTELIYVFLALGIIVFLAVSRLFYVFFNLGKNGSFKDPHKKIKTLVIAGSGGHTTEMLRLLSAMSDTYSPRHYVIANTDKMSEDKIKTMEAERHKHSKELQFQIIRIPRSREVRQSYMTSIVSTLYATFYAFPIVFKAAPDLVLCNGPGTCIPLCAAAFIMRFLGIKPVIQVYVESICRVENLSVSGLIMYYFADHLLVQWPQLKDKYPKSLYLGRVV
ncbi:UDP-N-acetylglucosamine transferase subunit ALG14-like [Amphiura filiformis]|uniref:UDP-N-acetylglucosamine transferase subunit ALG14-like n=1 Tax=Amphiura filiformis TaxID=82378 RepID=UPI003B221203